MSKTNLEKQIMNNEELSITPEQKEEAIRKEKYYRDLYNKIYDLNSTKSFKELSKDLIKGYENMINLYQDESKDKEDMKYIIKFAFRDFFLLIFINMKKVFDESEYLKDIHRKVYLSQNYVTLDQFEELINYCKNFNNNK